MQPTFIEMLGLKQSLTPSRNNGFLNMLKLMQRKAQLLSATASPAVAHDGAAPEPAEAGVDAAGPSARSGNGSSDNDAASASATTAGGGADSRTPVMDGVRRKLSEALKPSRWGGGEELGGTCYFKQVGGGDPHIGTQCKGLFPSSRAGTAVVACQSMTVSVCCPSRTDTPFRLVIIDESHKHAGHAAMRSAPGKAGGSGETHFIIEAVSAEFEGLTLIKRHRLVYQASSRADRGRWDGCI